MSHAIDPPREPPHGPEGLALVIGQAKGLSERVNDDAGTIVTQVRIASCMIHANDVGKILNGPTSRRRVQCVVRMLGQLAMTMNK